MILMNKTMGLIKRSLFLFATLLILGACTARIGDLTLISTKNIDLNSSRLDAREGKRVEGEDCVYWPLGLIPLGLPNLEEAVDEALEKGNGNILVDQVTYQKGYYFVIASVSCIQVEGTVLDAADGS